MRRRRSHYVFSSKPITHPVRKFFLRFFSLLIAIVLAVGLVNYGLTHMVGYERVSVTVSNLPVDLENWTILHFSDLHGIHFGKDQSGIRSAMGTVNVSSVVFTGDMVGKDGDVSAMLELVALLPQNKPRLYVPGDEDPPYLDDTAHNSLSPKAAWASALEDAGVIILDEPILYTRGNKDQARIWFVPADLYTLNLDAIRRNYQGQLDRFREQLSLTADEAAAKRVAEYQVARVDRIRESIRQMKDTDIQIAVSHLPITQDEMNASAANDSRSDVFSLRQASLILSGHWCGGQVRIPLLGAVSVPGMGSWPGDDRVRGLSYLNSIPQYISPGLGASSVYPWWQSIRFMNQPMVTRISLTSKYQ